MDKCCFARPWGRLGRWLGHHETLVWPSCPAFLKTTSNKNHVPGISCNRQVEVLVLQSIYCVLNSYSRMIVFHHAVDLQTPTAFGASERLLPAPPGTVTPWQLEDVQVLLEDPNLSPVPDWLVDIVLSFGKIFGEISSADRDNGKITNYSIRKTLINIEYIHEYTWFCRSGNSKLVLLWFPVVGKKHCFESSSWFLKPRSDKYTKHRVHLQGSLYHQPKWWRTFWRKSLTSPNIFIVVRSSQYGFMVV